MVKIVDHNFNKDLDAYIESRRKRKEPFKINKEKRSKMEEYQDEKTYKSSNKVTLSSLLRKRIPDDEEIQKKAKTKKQIEEVEEDLEEVEEIEDETEKESIMQKLKKIFAKKPSEDIYEEEQIDEEKKILDEDIKETIKILHRWLEQLPPDKLEQFKRSSDFVRYKELLRKLGMIKK